MLTRNVVTWGSAGTDRRCAGRGSLFYVHWYQCVLGAFFNILHRGSVQLDVELGFFVRTTTAVSHGCRYRAALSGSDATRSNGATANLENGLFEIVPYPENDQSLQE